MRKETRNRLLSIVLSVAMIFCNFSLVLASDVSGEGGVAQVGCNSIADEVVDTVPYIWPMPFGENVVPVQVSAGGNHSLAIMGDGSLWACA